MITNLILHTFHATVYKIYIYHQQLYYLIQDYYSNMFQLMILAIFRVQHYTKKVYGVKNTIVNNKW